MLDEVFQPSTTSTQVINPLRVSRNPILHKKIVPFEENPNIFSTQAPEPEQEAETDSDDLPDPELPIGHAQGALLAVLGAATELTGVLVARTAGSSSKRTTALSHEARDDAVEVEPVVEPQAR